MNTKRVSKQNKKKPKVELVIIEDEEEQEEIAECFGKHCSNTNNLIIGSCWNRYEQKVTDELICNECWEQNTKIKCVACSETHTYDKVKLMPNCFPWSFCGNGYNFYCFDCIKDIKERVE